MLPDRQDAALPRLQQEEGQVNSSGPQREGGANMGGLEGLAIDS